MFIFTLPTLSQLDSQQHPRRYLEQTIRYNIYKLGSAIPGTKAEPFSLIKVEPVASFFYTNKAHCNGLIVRQTTHDVMGTDSNKYKIWTRKPFIRLSYNSYAIAYYEMGSGQADQ